MMWGFSLRKRRWPIGLDIGEDSIKMIQLRRVGHRLSVWACARREFPEPSSGEGKQRGQLAVEAVREMLRTNRFHGRRVVSALSCRQLHVKNVRLPNLSPDQIRDAVAAEAKDRFDYQPGTDELCYLNAGAVRTGSESRNEIVILQACGETVNEHLSLLADMGLTPDHIDAEPVALFRGMGRLLRRRVDEQAVSVLLDVGHTAARVVVARGRRIVFIKRIDIGGRRLTEAVARQLNLSYAEARELRMRSMQNAHAGKQKQDREQVQGRNCVEWSIHDAVRGEVDALTREVALCLRYCSVTFRGLRPNRMTVTGGEAHDPALLRLLNEHMNIECVVGEPLKGIEVSGVDFGADRRTTLSEWAVAVGLALWQPGHAGRTSEEDHAERRLSA